MIIATMSGPRFLIWPPSGSILGPTGLVLLVGYFCHRLYAGGFLLEGDADYGVYFWRHYSLLRAGFDPSQRDYFASAPVLGAANPVHAVAIHLSTVLFGEPSLSVALFGNMLLSGLLLTAGSWSVFAMLRALGRSFSAAVLGAVVATFTGFQLVGVREFDHFYLQSYACVPIALLAALRLTYGDGKRLRAFLWLVITVHLSLVAGTNVPMFLYAPLFFILPIHAAFERRSASAGIQSTAWLVAAFALGIALTAPVLLDAMTTLQLQNRAGLTFSGGFGSFSPGDFVRTVFLRDWWSSGGIQYHERDVFFGAPVVGLALAGLVTGLGRGRRGAHAPAGSSAIERAARTVFLASALTALLVLHISLLPGWLEAVVAWYFEVQSIRFPMRFGMLLLLPVAYFVALGVDEARSSLLRGVTLGAIALTGGLLALTSEASLWRVMDGASVHMWLALTAQSVAGGLVFCCAKERGIGTRWGVVTLTVFVFLGYAWAQLPSTGYPAWLSASGLHTQTERVFGGWDWPRVLGIRPLYDRSLRLVEERFSVSPPHLAGAPDFVGRVMDLVPVYSHAHAPVTGHAFAFDMIADPAGHRLLWNLLRTGTESVLDLNHVGATVANRPASEPPILSHARTFAPPGQLPELHVRSAPLPLAFSVPGAVLVDDELGLLRAVAAAPRRVLERSVFLLSGSAAAVAPLGDSPGKVSSRYHAEKSTLELEVTQPGYVVISIPFHPQWVATRRDGGVLPVLRANYAFMAIPVDSAPAMIDLRFDRRDWRLAVWLSRLGLFLLTIAAVVVVAAPQSAATRVPA
jgi:hypothetical protein